MAKKKVVKDALVEEEKVKKEKKDGFFRKMYKEMKKVSWPSIGEVFKYSFAVLVFCLIFIGFFKLVELFSTFLKWVMS